MNRIEELEIWVSGLEEVLGEDWVPNNEQWKTIRTKIKTLASTPKPEPIYSSRDAVRAVVQSDGLLVSNAPPASSSGFPFSS